MFLKLTSKDFENGSVRTTTGYEEEPYDITTRIRTVDHFIFSGDKRNITVEVNAYTTKKIYLVLLGSTGNNISVFNLGWYENPHTFDISQYDIEKIRLIISYEDAPDIFPEDIKSVVIDSDYKWIYKDNTPVPVVNQNFPTDHSFPDARWTWRYSSDGIPYNGFMMISEPPEPKGAFRNCAKLERVYIPESVKYIGEEAFAGTALKTVKIAADCEYFPTSFPEGCIVEFYGGGGDYGQLYDRDGYAVLDSEAARIYVSKEK